MVYQGILGYIRVYCGILSYIKAYYGILWYIMVYRGILGYITVYHRIFGSLQRADVKSYALTRWGLASKAQDSAIVICKLIMNPRHPSTQILPTLVPKVCKY